MTHVQIPKRAQTETENYSNLARAQLFFTVKMKLADIISDISYLHCKSLNTKIMSCSCHNLRKMKVIINDDFQMLFHITRCRHHRPEAH